MRIYCDGSDDFWKMESSRCNFGQVFADMAKATRMPIPQEFLTMIPYILTLLALVGFVGKSRAPKASGLPYEK